eukprot:360256-Chlamydomonas_euryale.AAC.2
MSLAPACPPEGWASGVFVGAAVSWVGAAGIAGGPPFRGWVRLGSPVSPRFVGGCSWDRR